MSTENKDNIHHGELVEVEEVVEFTPAYRWQHWIRALTIVVLTFTGFYIAYPFIDPSSNPEPTNFLYANMRAVHLAFGFLMIAAVLIKTYLTLLGKADTYKAEFVSMKDLINPKIWIHQLGYYMFLSKHPPLKGVYNPLQFMAYFAMYILFYLLIITGIVLYVHVYHEGLGGALYGIGRWFEVLMGGLANVREIHHISMWALLIIIVIHIYMAVFNAVFGKNGSMDAIFSGMKWNKKH
ncbi:MAG: Ni/Fe-hydrogenase, b-type cytochrome subunit [Sulfurovum sp.]|nr:MAG: Ni/Fe-hydrogenase, b-type cytochrome subunit [Sulfurovum sp.]